ncbi:MAG: hypothetical protein WDO12_09980 [Pseudomonadota bacterium]
MKAGDVVSIREKSRKQLRVANSLTVAAQVGFPDWLEVNEKEFRGTFKAALAAATSCRISTKTSLSSCIRSNAGV